MLVLTPADVKNGIKYGVGIDEFCTKYGCTTEEFIRRVRGMYHEKAYEILGEIRASERKHRKDRSHLKSSKMKGTSAAPLEMPVDTETESDETEQDAPTSVGGIESELELLRAEEKSVSDKIMTEENDYQLLLSHHKEHLGQLREIQKELIRVEHFFRAKSGEFKAITTEDNQLVESMNRISEARRANVKTLESIREKIKILEIVTLYAYDDGNITIIDGPSMELDDTGADEHFPQLVAYPECENLTVRQIRLIARMLCIVKNATAPTEVLFDSEPVGKAYNQIVSTTIA